MLVLLGSIFAELGDSVLSCDMLIPGSRVEDQDGPGPAEQPEGFVPPQRGR